MPTPRASENRDEWMERCVPAVIRDGTVDTDKPPEEQREQAVAICSQMWRNRDTRTAAGSEEKTMQVKRVTSAQIKALDDEGQGRAVIATLNTIDKDGDVTVPGAFGAQGVKIVPAHDWGHIPLGKGTIREEGNEAIADFQLNLDIEAGRDWHSALKFDLENGQPLQEWSYGFAISDEGADFGEFEGQQVRFLKRLKVFEISPVILGAGEGTRTVAIKNHGGSIKFAHQVQAAIDELTDIVKRAGEIRSVRQAEGRDLSDERIKQLREAKNQLDLLASQRDEIARLIEPEKSIDLGSLYAEILETQRRVHDTIG